MSPLLWHLSFHLIPCGSQDRIEIAPGAARTIGNAELTPCWEARVGADLSAVFDSALPRSAGTALLCDRWGCEEGITVEVWRLPQGVSVYVRIHIISAPADDIERFMVAVRGAELSIVLNDLRVIEASASEMMAEIQDLSAERFLASPTQFLKDLSGFA